jgi:hypothetical protein
MLPVPGSDQTYPFHRPREKQWMRPNMAITHSVGEFAHGRYISLVASDLRGAGQSARVGRGEGRLEGWIVGFRRCRRIVVSQECVCSFYIDCSEVLPMLRYLLRRVRRLR